MQDGRGPSCLICFGYKRPDDEKKNPRYGLGRQVFFPLIKIILELKYSHVSELHVTRSPAHLVEIQPKKELPANKEAECFL